MDRKKRRRVSIPPPPGIEPGRSCPQPSSLSLELPGSQLQLFTHLFIYYLLTYLFIQDVTPLVTFNISHQNRISQNSYPLLYNLSREQVYEHTNINDLFIYLNSSIKSSFLLHLNIKQNYCLFSNILGKRMVQKSSLQSSIYCKQNYNLNKCYTYKDISLIISREWIYMG